MTPSLHPNFSEQAAFAAELEACHNHWLRQSRIHPPTSDAGQLARAKLIECLSAANHALGAPLRRNIINPLLPPAVTQPSCA